MQTDAPSRREASLFSASAAGGVGISSGGGAHFQRHHGMKGTRDIRLPACPAAVSKTRWASPWVGASSSFLKQCADQHQVICIVGSGGAFCGKVGLERVNVHWGSPRRSLRLLSGISGTTILPVLQLNRRSVKWYSVLIVRD